MLFFRFLCNVAKGLSCKSANIQCMGSEHKHAYFTGGAVALIASGVVLTLIRTVSHGEIMNIEPSALLLTGLVVLLISAMGLL